MKLVVTESGGPLQFSGARTVPVEAATDRPSSSVGDALGGGASTARIAVRVDASTDSIDVAWRGGADGASVATATYDASDYGSPMSGAVRASLCEAYQRAREHGHVPRIPALLPLLNVSFCDTVAPPAVGPSGGCAAVPAADVLPGGDHDAAGRAAGGSAGDATDASDDAGAGVGDAARAAVAQLLPHEPTATVRLLARRRDGRLWVGAIGYAVSSFAGQTVPATAYQMIVALLSHTYAATWVSCTSLTATPVLETAMVALIPDAVTGGDGVWVVGNTRAPIGEVGYLRMLHGPGFAAGCGFALLLKTSLAYAIRNVFLCGTTAGVEATAAAATSVHGIAVAYATRSIALNVSRTIFPLGVRPGLLGHAGLLALQVANEVPTMRPIGHPYGEAEARVDALVMDWESTHEPRRLLAAVRVSMGGAASTSSYVLQSGVVSAQSTVLVSLSPQLVPTLHTVVASGAGVFRAVGVARSGGSIYVCGNAVGALTVGGTATPVGGARDELYVNVAASNLGAPAGVRIVSDAGGDLYARTCIADASGGVFSVGEYWGEHVRGGVTMTLFKHEYSRFHITRVVGTTVTGSQPAKAKSIYDHSFAWAIAPAPYLPPAPAPCSFVYGGRLAVGGVVRVTGGATDGHLATWAPAAGCPEATEALNTAAKLGGVRLTLAGLSYATIAQDGHGGYWLGCVATGITLFPGSSRTLSTTTPTTAPTTFMGRYDANHVLIAVASIPYASTAAGDDGRPVSMAGDGMGGLWVAVVSAAAPFPGGSVFPTGEMAINGGSDVVVVRFTASGTPAVCHVLGTPLAETVSYIGVLDDSRAVVVGTSPGSPFRANAVSLSTATTPFAGLFVLVVHGHTRTTADYRRIPAGAGTDARVFGAAVVPTSRHTTYKEDYRVYVMAANLLAVGVRAYLFSANPTVGPLSDTVSGTSPASVRGCIAIEYDSMLWLSNSGDTPAVGQHERYSRYDVYAMYSQPAMTIMSQNIRASASTTSAAPTASTYAGTWGCATDGTSGLFSVSTWETSHTRAGVLIGATKGTSLTHVTHNGVVDWAFNIEAPATGEVALRGVVVLANCRVLISGYTTSTTAVVIGTTSVAAASASSPRSFVAEFYAPGCVAPPVARGVSGLMPNVSMAVPLATVNVVEQDGDGGWYAASSLVWSDAARLGMATVSTSGTAYYIMRYANDGTMIGYTQVMFAPDILLCGAQEGTLWASGSMGGSNTRVCSGFRAATIGTGTHTIVCHYNFDVPMGNVGLFGMYTQTRPSANGLLVTGMVRHEWHAGTVIAVLGKGSQPNIVHKGTTVSPVGSGPLLGAMMVLERDTTIQRWLPMESTAATAPTLHPVVSAVGASALVPDVARWAVAVFTSAFSTAAAVSIGTASASVVSGYGSIVFATFGVAMSVPHAYVVGTTYLLESPTIAAGAPGEVYIGAQRIRSCLTLTSASSANPYAAVVAIKDAGGGTFSGVATHLSVVSTTFSISRMVSDGVGGVWVSVSATVTSGDPKYFLDMPGGVASFVRPGSVTGSTTAVSALVHIGNAANPVFDAVNGIRTYAHTKPQVDVVYQPQDGPGGQWATSANVKHAAGGTTMLSTCELLVAWQPTTTTMNASFYPAGQVTYSADVRTAFVRSSVGRHCRGRGGYVGVPYSFHTSHHLAAAHLNEMFVMSMALVGPYGAWMAISGKLGLPTVYGTHTCSVSSATGMVVLVRMDPYVTVDPWRALFCITVGTPVDETILGGSVLIGDEEGSAWLSLGNTEVSFNPPHGGAVGLFFAHVSVGGKLMARDVVTSAGAQVQTFGGAMTPRGGLLMNIVSVSTVGFAHRGVTYPAIGAYDWVLAEFVVVHTPGQALGHFEIVKSRQLGTTGAYPTYMLHPTMTCGRTPDEWGFAVVVANVFPNIFLLLDPLGTFFYVGGIIRFDQSLTPVVFKEFALNFLGGAGSIAPDDEGGLWSCESAVRLLADEPSIANDVTRRLDRSLRTLSVHVGYDATFSSVTMCARDGIGGVWSGTPLTIGNTTPDAHVYVGYRGGFAVDAFDTNDMISWRIYAASSSMYSRYGTDVTRPVEATSLNPQGPADKVPHPSVLLPLNDCRTLIPAALVPRAGYAAPGASPFSATQHQVVVTNMRDSLCEQRPRRSHVAPDRFGCFGRGKGPAAAVQVYNGARVAAIGVAADAGGYYVAVYKAAAGGPIAFGGAVAGAAHNVAIIKFDDTHSHVASAVFDWRTANGVGQNRVGALAGTTDGGVWVLCDVSDPAVAMRVGELPARVVEQARGGGDVAAIRLDAGLRVRVVRVVGEGGVDQVTAAAALPGGGVAVTTTCTHPCQSDAAITALAGVRRGQVYRLDGAGAVAGMATVICGDSVAPTPQTVHVVGVAPAGQAGGVVVMVAGTVAGTCVPNVRPMGQAAVALTASAGPWVVRLDDRNVAYVAAGGPLSGAAASPLGAAAHAGRAAMHYYGAGFTAFCWGGPGRHGTGVYDGLGSGTWGGDVTEAALDGTSRVCVPRGGGGGYYFAADMTGDVVMSRVTHERLSGHSTSVVFGHANSAGATYTEVFRSGRGSTGPLGKFTTSGGMALLRNGDVVFGASLDANAAVDFGTGVVSGQADVVVAVRSWYPANSSGFGMPGLVWDAAQPRPSGPEFVVAGEQVVAAVRSSSLDGALYLAVVSGGVLRIGRGGGTLAAGAYTVTIPMGAEWGGLRMAAAFSGGVWVAVPLGAATGTVTLPGSVTYAKTSTRRCVLVLHAAHADDGGVKYVAACEAGHATDVVDIATRGTRELVVALRADGATVTLGGTTIPNTNSRTAFGVVDHEMAVVSLTAWASTGAARATAVSMTGICARHFSNKKPRSYADRDEYVVLAVTEGAVTVGGAVGTMNYKGLVAVVLDGALGAVRVSLLAADVHATRNDPVYGLRARGAADGAGGIWFTFAREGASVPFTTTSDGVLAVPTHNVLQLYHVRVNLSTMTAVRWVRGGTTSPATAAAGLLVDAAVGDGRGGVWVGLAHTRVLGYESAHVGVGVRGTSTVADDLTSVIAHVRADGKVDSYVSFAHTPAADVRTWALGVWGEDRSVWGYTTATTVGGVPGTVAVVGGGGGSVGTGNRFVVRLTQPEGGVHDTPAYESCWEDVSPPAHAASDPTPGTRMLEGLAAQSRRLSDGGSVEVVALTTAEAAGWPTGPITQPSAVGIHRRGRGGGAACAMWATQAYDVVPSRHGGFYVAILSSTSAPGYVDGVALPVTSGPAVHVLHVNHRCEVVGRLSITSTAMFVAKAVHTHDGVAMALVQYGVPAAAYQIVGSAVTLPAPVTTQEGLVVSFRVGDDGVFVLRGQLVVRSEVTDLLWHADEDAVYVVYRVAGAGPLAVGGDVGTVAMSGGGGLLLKCTATDLHVQHALGNVPTAGVVTIAARRAGGVWAVFESRTSPPLGAPFVPSGAAYPRGLGATSGVLMALGLDATLAPVSHGLIGAASQPSASWLSDAGVIPQLRADGVSGHAHGVWVTMLGSARTYGDGFGGSVVLSQQALGTMSYVAVLLVERQVRDTIGGYAGYLRLGVESSSYNGGGAMVRAASGPYGACRVEMGHMAPIVWHEEVGGKWTAVAGKDLPGANQYVSVLHEAVTRVRCHVPLDIEPIPPPLLEAPFDVGVHGVCEGVKASTTGGYAGNASEGGLGQWEWGYATPMRNYTAFNSRCRSPHAPTMPGAVAVPATYDYVRAPRRDVGSVFCGTVGIGGEFAVVASSGMSVDVYVRGSDTYRHLQQLRSYGAEGADAFGASVSLRGPDALRTLAIGAPRNGVREAFPTHNRVSAGPAVTVGAVHVYELEDSSGTRAPFREVGYLKPPHAVVDTALFGTSVAVSSDGRAIAIGSPGDGRSGTNPITVVSGGSVGAPGASANSGSVFVFARAHIPVAAAGDGWWAPTSYLKEATVTAGAQFGQRVAIDGAWPDYHVAGASSAQVTIFGLSVASYGIDATLQFSEAVSVANAAAVTLLYGSAADRILVIGETSFAQCGTSFTSSGTCANNGRATVYKYAAAGTPKYQSEAVFSGLGGSVAGQEVGYALDAAVVGTKVAVAVVARGLLGTTAGRRAGASVAGGAYRGGAFVIHRAIGGGAGTWAATTYVAPLHSHSSGDFVSVAVGSVRAIGGTGAHTRVLVCDVGDRNVHVGVGVRQYEDSADYRGALLGADGWVL